LLEFGEDDDASAGLKEALDLDFDVLAYGGVAVVDDDHGAVGEIADTLALVFAFATMRRARTSPGKRTMRIDFAISWRLT